MEPRVLNRGRRAFSSNFTQLWSVQKICDDHGLLAESIRAEFLTNGIVFGTPNELSPCSFIEVVWISFSKMRFLFDADIDLFPDPYSAVERIFWLAWRNYPQFGQFERCCYFETNLAFNCLPDICMICCKYGSPPRKTRSREPLAFDVPCCRSWIMYGTSTTWAPIQRSCSSMPGK